MNGKSRSARALIASRRNQALRDASFCDKCGILVPDDFRQTHLKEKHNIGMEEPRD